MNIPSNVILMEEENASLLEITQSPKKHY